MFARRRLARASVLPVAQGLYRRGGVRPAAYGRLGNGTDRGNLAVELKTIKTKHRVASRPVQTRCVFCPVL